MIGIIILLVLDSCLAEGFTTDREGGFSSSRYGKVAAPARDVVLECYSEWHTWILKSLGDPKNYPPPENLPNHPNHQNHERHTFWWSHDRGTWSQFCRAFWTQGSSCEMRYSRGSAASGLGQCDTGHIMCLWKWEVFPQFLVTLGWTKNLGDTMGYHILRERQLWGFHKWGYFHGTLPIFAL